MNKLLTKRKHWHLIIYWLVEYEGIEVSQYIHFEPNQKVDQILQIDSLKMNLVLPEIEKRIFKIKKYCTSCLWWDNYSSN